MPPPCPPRHHYPPEPKTQKEKEKRKKKKENQNKTHQKPSKPIAKTTKQPTTHHATTTTHHANPTQPTNPNSTQTPLESKIPTHRNPKSNPSKPKRQKLIAKNQTNPSEFTMPTPISPRWAHTDLCHTRPTPISSMLWPLQSLPRQDHANLRHAVTTLNPT